MNNKTILIACGLVLALAGCNKSGQQTTATGGSSGGGSSAPAASATSKLNPGLWETSATVAVQGLPANVAQMMKGTNMTSRHCLTPEQADRPTNGIFGNPKNGCTYQRMSMSGGTIDAAMTCTGERGRGAGTMEIKGQYGGDSFDVTMKMTGLAGGQTATFATHTVGHRVSPECPADLRDK